MNERNNSFEGCRVRCGRPGHLTGNECPVSLSCLVSPHFAAGRHCSSPGQPRLGWVVAEPPRLPHGQHVAQHCSFDKTTDRSRVSGSGNDELEYDSSPYILYALK